MFSNTLRVLKKSPTSDWSVILNPIASELSKNETIQKIVEVFPITSSEAEELVERTPLILLESLSEEDATRVREHFAQARIDLMISNDATLRRRCYRTVWPEQPSLGFIKEEINAPKISQRDEPDRDALRPSANINKSTVSEKRSPLLSEDDYFNKPLPKKIEKLEPSPRYGESVVRETAKPPAVDRPVPSKTERDSIIDELREKLLSVQRKAGELEEQNKKLEQALSRSEKEKDGQMALSNLETQRRSFDSLSFEYEKKQVLLEEKVDQLTGERDQLIEDLSKARAKCSEFEAERNRLSSEQEMFLKRLAFKEKELEQIKAVVERQQRMEDENKQLRERYEELAAESEERLKRYRMFEDEKRTAEMRAAQLSDEIQRVKKEREEETVQVRDELEMLRRRAKDAEIVKGENKSLQEELRVARERLKEFTVNREQQEAITKRLRLQNELIEREARLKELVKKQEIIEREIVERGQVIQQVLSEQEEIEREIVRAKQAQKYLTEQIKSREKPYLRTRGRLEVKGPESLGEEADEV